MQEIELAGEDYEMGQQYGRLLDEVGFEPQPISEEKAAFVHDCLPAVSEHMPELLTELRGIADAGDWDVDLISAIPLALGYESGCSVLAVAGNHTSNAIPLFGRNYDFYTSFADFGELYRTRPTDRFNSIGPSDHWTGRHGGINEAGLAIGHTFVPNSGPQPGIMFGIAARWVLDTCCTATEAVSFLEGISHARNTNFVVGDSTGEIAIVEASPERVTTTKPKTGLAVVTNHFVSEPMKEYEPESADRSNSEARYTRLTNWFENIQTKVDVTAIQHVLADPVDGACSCTAHGDGDPVETLWSWTTALDQPSIQLADGRPDETSYERFEL
jgi:predicted choloylglycine hydrolase